MNNEQLTAYLKDESYLYSLSYEELKTLVVEYPYANNLRILLLKKAYLDQNKDYDRNLQMAAAYTTNRRHLYKTIQKLKTLQNVPQNIILGEDYLELTELSNIEKILQDRHVTEVFSDTNNALTSQSAAQWSGIEFEEPQNDSISASEAIKTAVNEDTEGGDFFDLTIPIVAASKLESLVSDNNDFVVNVAVEAIMAEFGSVALDLSGTPNSKTDFNSTEPEMSKTPFEETPLSILEVSTVEIEKEQLEIPPINLGDQDPEFLSIPIEETPSIADESIKLSVDSEEKEPLNTLVKSFKNGNGKVWDFEALETKSLDDYQDEDTIIENILLQSPKGIATHIPFEQQQHTDLVSEKQETLPEINMKKPEIEIEIVNNSKAVIVDKEPSVQSSDSQAVSFTEWLRQFKVAVPKISETEPQIFQNKEKKIEIPIKTEEPQDTKHVLDDKVVALLFETPSDLPDNLFGFNTLDTSLKVEEALNGIIENEAEEAPKKKKKKKYMHELAARSIEESDDLISETLADILAWQGNNAKAIEMYEKLGLQFPEKNDYFAAKIQKLRNI